MSFPQFGTLVEEEKKPFPEFGTVVEEKKPVSIKETAKEVIPEVFKGLGRVTAKGAVSLLAAPTKGIGNLLNLISSFGREGRTGTELFRKAGEYFKNIGEEGQNQLKSDIERVLGKSYGTGEEALTRFIERGAEIYGQLPLKGMTIPAAIGAVAGQTAEELGASPDLQMIAELTGIAAPDIAKGLFSLAKKPFVSESGLRLPKIAEKEAIKGIKPKVIPGKKEKIFSEISTKAEGLINDIKKESIPIAKEIEEGIDVYGKAERNLNKVEALSKKLPHEIESNLISDYLNQAESNIKTGITPTEEQEKILKLINKFKKNYGVSEGTTRFYSPDKYLRQFRNLNKDLKNLYQTKFVHGERRDTMKFYEGLKDAIEETFSQGAPQEFSNLFKEANKEFSQIKRLEKFDEIMGKVSTDKGTLDTKKLDKFVKDNKKANILRSQIGEEGFNKLRLISNDLSKAKNKLDLIQEFGFKDIIKSGLAQGVLSYLGFPIKLPLATTKKALELGRGYILSSPQGSRDVSNLLKALRAGNKKAVRASLMRMNRNASDYERKNRP